MMGCKEIKVNNPSCSDEKEWLDCEDRMAMGYFLGVDVGSLSCDGALIDGECRLVASLVLPTGASGKAASETLLQKLVEAAGIGPGQILLTIATGYGRERVAYATKAITEITCHGRGAHYFFPMTDLVIDIGGQDSKAIRIDRQGKVLDFVMNDRCAAGTGRFLEVMARALEIELVEMGHLSLQAESGCQISSICTVFAESEVVSLLANGTPVDQVARGLHEAVARRTIGLLQRVKPLRHDVVTLSGGVALNVGVVAAMERLLDRKVNSPSDPQIVGAVGAALLARDFYLKQPAAGPTRN
jgi:(R)-2-hydroxyacyl-CoA dehydratese activating ATPase